MLATAVPGGRLDAQQVERVGSGPAALDQPLDRLLASGDYVLIASDTLLTVADTVPGALLVLDATAIVEGVVAGDLVGVDANVFLRPGARIGGAAVNLGGGLYRSELAQIEGGIMDVPLAPYHVIREPGRFRIVVRSDERALVLDGLAGFHAPSYDRVNALTLEWGAAYRPPAFAGFEPRLHGQVGYVSGRGALTGALALSLRRGPTRLTLGAEKQVATNEEWIRRALRNSLSFFVAGNDYRNYYQVERAYAELGRRFGSETRGWTLSARAQLEDSRSLSAGDPWTLFGDDFRPNPIIDDGRIASVILEGDGTWKEQSSRFQGGGRVELAGAALGGDFSFARFVLWGEAGMRALSNHTLEVEGRFQGPLPGTGSLPRQRWSFIGGSGTLGTFAIGEFRGDRLAFVRTEYIIPLPRRFELPLLGVPDLGLLYAAGMAWTQANARGLEQNVGVRLQFFGPYLRLITDPSRPIDALELDLGLSWPFEEGFPTREGR